MTNGGITFNCERGNSQDRCIGGSFGGEITKSAERLSEHIGIKVPEGVRLLRQAKDQEQEVRNGQVKQVIVGGSVHVLLPSNHSARADISHNSSDENDAVDDRDGDNGGQGFPLWPKDREKIDFG